MKNLLKFGFLFFMSLSLLMTTSCKDDDETTPVSSKVDFGDAPSASIITVGTVEVITEDKVRYHVINTVTATTVTIIESKTGVVMMDVGFSTPPPIATFGTELKAYADAIGKTVSVIITHGHGDHFGNIGEFSDSDIYAESVVAGILGGNEAFAGLTINPVTSTETIAGIVFTFDKISNAETNENSYIYMENEKAFFAEDLIYNKAHNYIREYTPLEGEDELDNWISGLNEFKTEFADYNYVFVGHGNGGMRTDVSTVIDENIAYLTDAKELIAGTKELSTGGFATTNQEVVDELLLLYSDYLPSALNLSLPGAFGEQDPGAIWFE